MEIGWDDPKRLANILKHGLDFRDLTREFFRAAVIVEARTGRFKAVGRLADGTIAVIFARLGTEGVSVISMRPANFKERRLLDGQT